MFGKEGKGKKEGKKPGQALWGGRMHQVLLLLLDT